MENEIKIKSLTDDELLSIYKMIDDFTSFLNSELDNVKEREEEKA